MGRNQQIWDVVEGQPIMRDLTPKWQMSLLARFPRPIAILVIGILRPLARFGNWITSADGIDALSLALLFLGIPGSAGLLTHSWLNVAIAFVVVILSVLALIGFYNTVDRFTAWYRSIDRSLPRREKKDESAAE